MQVATSHSADGQCFDDVLGSDPWLLARFAQGAMRTHISGKELKVFSLEDKELAPFRAPLIAWFNEHAAQAVLVRPDCYVFGTGIDAALLSARQAATTSNHDRP